MKKSSREGKGSSRIPLISIKHEDIRWGERSVIKKTGGGGLLGRGDDGGEMLVKEPVEWSGPLWQSWGRASQEIWLPVIEGLNKTIKPDCYNDRTGPGRR